ncbi:MAG: hypothetical protein JOZ90_09435 [Alphaproteobacteria bacterium]|nr:hypothetical protein [Alphaproteobacteria bacterium]MBV9371860.1 hypothetical protein [Alphaproteobacteria bacterium]MBV9901307.1 hypothetical protein [Alphaproteobacteria bacterium]
MTLRSSSLIAAGCALAFATTAEAKQIPFTGCVTLRGGEAPCVTVRLGRGVYNLNGVRPMPDPSRGFGITGYGTPSGPQAMCTGTHLNNVTWHYSRILRCPKMRATKRS